MKPSVVQGLSDRPLEAGQELHALNLEVRPVLKQVREVLNYQSVFRLNFDYPAGTALFDAWRSERVPDEGAWLTELHAFGRNDGGGWRVQVRQQLWNFVAGVGTSVLSNFSLNSFAGAGYGGTPTLSFVAADNVLRVTLGGPNSTLHAKESLLIKVQEVVL